MKLFQRNNPENKQVEEHGCCQGEEVKQDMKKSKKASCGCEHDESYSHEEENGTSHGCC